MIQFYWVNYIVWFLDEFVAIFLIIPSICFSLLELETNNINIALLFSYAGVFFFFTIILGFLFNNYLGLYGVWIINIFSLFILWTCSLVTSIWVFSYNLVININFGKWFILPTNTIVYFEFICDSLSMSYATLTITIALSVICYTFVYFRYEPLVDRLILLICSFVISMVMLVTAGNLIMLFLGWELIGLTSFFLINFWNTRVATLKSAFKAFVFNKFSDISLLIGILYLYNETYSIDIITNANQLLYLNYHVINIWFAKIPVFEIIVFFFIICAFIKSAQFGFHIWLPDSMEAPVPASALIHSATLVSAGIFLILRFHTLFELSWFANLLFIFLGSFTAFYGGFCAIFQSDIKKLLAYSTISHCGFLFLTASTHIYEYTIIYLYIHGLFKAASFLCVGNVIRFSSGYQDFRRMGNLTKYLPFEFFSLLICLLNLSGVPFSLGFFSKHILIIGFNNFIVNNKIILINILGGAGCGFYYSYRLLYNVFFDFKKEQKHTLKHANWEMCSNQNNFENFFYLRNIDLGQNLFLSQLTPYLAPWILNNNTLNKFCYYQFSTTLAKWSISLLIFIAYIYIIVFFFWFFNLSEFVNVFFFSNFFSTQIFDLFNGSKNILQNLFIINIILLNVIVYLFYSLFRFTLSNELYYLNLNLVLNFLVLNFLVLNFLN